MDTKVLLYRGLVLKIHLLVMAFLVTRLPSSSSSSLRERRRWLLIQRALFRAGFFEADTAVRCTCPQLVVHLDVLEGAQRPLGLGERVGFLYFLCWFHFLIRLRWVCERELRMLDLMEG